MTIHSSEFRVWLVAVSVSVIAHIAIIGYDHKYKEALVESQNKALTPIVHLTLEQLESKQSKARNAELKKPELKQPEPKKTENNTPEPKQPEHTIPVFNKPELKQPESISDESSQLSVMSNAPISSPISDDQRNEYFRLLIAHIETHKYYPRRARNRDIEGIVEISFDLLKNGDVINIRTSGGNRLLRVAATHAIRRSLPLPAPPSFLQLPLEMHFSMRFDIR